jgi:hypothetical protein
MLPRPGLELHVVIAAVLCGACAHNRADGSGTDDAAGGPAGEGIEHTFVSTDRNKELYQYEEEPEAARFKGDYDQEYVITSPEEAKDLAEAAVGLHLNSKQTWKASPILPASWPADDKTVMLLYYPMADNPHSMSQYQLFSAAYRVTVCLVDGTTEIHPLKPRKLGTVVQKRPSFLERNELELAEKALVHMILGGEAESGEDNFWGYLKYFHEHPKFARDIKRRAPKFVHWLHARKKYRYRR